MKERQLRRFFEIPYNTLVRRINNNPKYIRTKSLNGIQYSKYHGCNGAITFSFIDDKLYLIDLVRNRPTGYFISKFGLPINYRLTRDYYTNKYEYREMYDFYMPDNRRIIEWMKENNISRPITKAEQILFNLRFC